MRNIEENIDVFCLQRSFSLKYSDNLYILFKILTFGLKIAFQSRPKKLSAFI